MNLFIFSLIAGYSIGIAVVIGLVRYPQVLRHHRPFLLVCFLSLINEAVSLALVSKNSSNAVNSNLYILAESVLFVWQFATWSNKPGYRRMLVRAVVPALIILWTYDNLVCNNLAEFSSFYRVCYSACLITLAIRQLNSLLVDGGIRLLTDARFMISMGILIFYSYKSTIEMFYVLMPGASEQFYRNSYTILLIINLLVNLLYAVAALCLPTKRKLLLRF